MREGHPPYEVIAQGWDGLVQVIEHRHLELEGVMPSSKRTSFLQQWVESKEAAEIAAGLREVREIGNRAASGLYPTEAQSTEFLEAVLTWLSRTGWPLPDHEMRVRYSPQEVNQTGFEWGGRYRMFRVMHGSVARSEAQVLVTSSIIQENGEWKEGQALEALKKKVGLGPERRQLFRGEALEVKLHDTEHEDAPYDRVLVVGIPVAWGDHLDADQYHRVCRAVLSALRAEETWNEGQMLSVACTLLAGNRLGAKLEPWVASELIGLGKQWMRSSESGESFQVIVFKSEEAESFSKAMDEALGRGIERIVEHPVAEPLRKELLDTLDQLPPTLKEGAGPLIGALDSEDGLTVEVVCTFARKWTEVLVHDFLQERSSGDLCSSIEKLRTSNAVAPWITSYMHTCRVMGNKAVHNRNTEPPYYDRLHGSDLIVVMSAVHALAKFSTHKTGDAAPEVESTS